MIELDQFPPEFFEALGEPKPGHQFGLLEDYRFHLVYQHLASGSVLDVGAYFGDFLKLARQDQRQISGTEINMARVNLANSILGEDVVILDSRNGSLNTLQDNSVDNVVCMEVIEHQPDHKYAVSELCRVARSKVIITVPFRERIKTVICLHCHKYTPHAGHLHSYDFGSFAELVPHNWQVVKEVPFASLLTRKLKSILPRHQISIMILKFLDFAFSISKGWLMVVLEPVKHNKEQ